MISNNCQKKMTLFIVFAVILLVLIVSISFHWFDKVNTTIKAQTVDSRIKNNTTKKFDHKSDYINNNQTSNTIFESVIKPDDVFEVKMQPGLMTLINSTFPKFPLTVNGSYLLENRNLCSSMSNLTVFIMVLSAPGHFDRRNVIRQTWANESFYMTYGTAKVIFLLGIIKDLEIQNLIEKEHTMFGDILQGSFIDSYHNLSHKSVMGYKWASERCRNAKFLIKTDDDIVINMFHVLKSEVPMLLEKRYHVRCLRLYNIPINRDPHNKFFVNPYQFKGKKHLPYTYCYGNYVMMLNKVVPYLYEAASKTPLFWIDDVFVYGLAMSNIKGLRFMKITPKEYGKYNNNKATSCWKREKPRCNYIYHVTNNIKEMKMVWSYILHQYL